MNSNKNMTNNTKLALFVKNILCYHTSGTGLVGSPGQSSLGATAAVAEGREGSKQAISYNHDDHNRHWVVCLSLRAPSLHLEPALGRTKGGKGKEQGASQPDAELK